MAHLQSIPLGHQQDSVYVSRMQRLRFPFRQLLESQAARVGVWVGYLAREARQRMSKLEILGGLTMLRLRFLVNGLRRKASVG
jgi:hypothetical protein